MSADPAPLARIYLLYGDDQAAIAERAAEVCAAAGGQAEILRLDGEKISLDDLYTAAYVLPFFTTARVVVLSNPFGKLVTGSESRSRLQSILEGLPDTTTLILVVADEYQGGKKGWKIMGDSKKGGKAVLNWAEAAKNAGQAVSVELFRPLRASDMVAWIIQRAKKEGGAFTPRAAAALAQLTGSERGLAAQEIVKLLTYVAYSRPVDVDDVQAAAASSRVSDVFAMVDALAEGNTAKALRQLQRLLTEQDPYSLFGMVVRQYRLLLLTKDLLAAGPLEQKKLAGLLDVHDFVAGKLLAQSRRYNLTDLEAIYHRLAEIDMIMKTGGADPEVALQVFAASPTSMNL